MKVFLPSLNKKPSTGKGFFFQRLATRLSKEGTDVIGDDTKRVDVALHNTRVRKNNAKYNVVRIDGVYNNNKQDYKSLNAKVFKDLHKKAHAVIYQSVFSRAIADKYLGVFDGLKTVIPNGADPAYYKDLTPINRKFQYNFISTSRWRPHKRLRDIIESFLLAEINNSCLYIAGDLKKSGLGKDEIKKYFNLSNVIHLGKLNQKEIGRYLISCNAFIHICWYDSCPNGVVEAICAGLPVITNNSGGTREIVSLAGGPVLSLDNWLNELEPCDLYNPPKIDRNSIANTMKAICQYGSNLNLSSSHVDINSIAIKYLNFFKKVVEWEYTII